ncbi:MAG: rRNA maturation RNase YbeY [Candidatus Parcubacteria bacterium]|jgi:probable rRNA maturation factor
MITYRFTGAAPRTLPPALLKRVARAMHGVRGIPRASAVIGVRAVTPRQMQTLNRTFRGKDRPTDVLSFSEKDGATFPLSTPRGEERELGDLVLCPSYATKEARRRAIAPQEEMVRLLVHGTLHLAGMDHRTEAEEMKMFGIQERVVSSVLPAM